MKTPSDLKYTKNDEWIRVEGQTGTIGITDYAQEQLSDVVFVEIIVEVGDTVKQGNAIAAVESVKAASDVYSPASGTVTAVNDALPGSPESVNTDPYGQAWMVKIEVSDPAEIDRLLDASAYEELTASKQ